MKARWIAVVIIFACLGMIYWLFNTLQSELAPIEDRSMFRLSVTTPKAPLTMPWTSM